MRQRARARNLAVLLALLLPFTQAAGGPGDTDPVDMPGVVVHCDETISKTAETATVWGHVKFLTEYTSSLTIYHNGVKQIGLILSEDVQQRQTNVIDHEFRIDLAALGLQPNDTLDYEFEVNNYQYSETNGTIVVE